MHARQARIAAIVATLMLLATGVVGRAQTPSYQVAVGQLTVSRATGWDALSSPDFQVQVRRQDPVIAATVTALNDRMSELADEAEQLLDQIRPLEMKEAQSKIRPGPPLTDSERELLAVLSAMPLSEVRDFHRAELNRLNNKIEESGRQPGPPLTATEEVRLQSLEVRRRDVLRERQSTSDEHSRTLALIYGQTRTIGSDSRTLDFNSGAVLTVYEGDRLQITVVDEDVFDDDVIGRHTLAVTGQIVERGFVELGPSSFIRALELHFTPTSR